MASQRQIQKKTSDLLKKQAELIGQTKSIQNNYSLPVYKSSKQIKQENYELRHQKTVTRVLKMHSVMPNMLRKVTEPRKHFVKDYAIDVDKRVQEVLANWELEKKKRQIASKTAENTISAKERQSLQESNDMAPENEEFFGTEKKKSSLLQLPDKNVTAAWSAGSTLKPQPPGQNRANTVNQKPSRNSKLTSQRSSTYLATRQRRASQIEEEKPPPQGALVVIDDHANNQIDAIQKGKNLTGKSMKESLKVGLMKRVDNFAIDKVKELRRKMSMIKYSGDDEMKQAAKQMFQNAADLQAKTHHQLKVRPTDRIKMMENKVWEKDRRREQVGHSHFVKMSFEQLPADLQQLILQSNQSEKSTRLHSRHNSAQSISQRSPQRSSLRKNGSRPSSSVTRTRRQGIYNKRLLHDNNTSGGIAVRNKYDIPSSSATQRNRFSVDYQEDEDATTAAGGGPSTTSAQHQQDSQRLLQNQLNKMTQNRRATGSAYDSVSMATICEQEDIEATTIHLNQGKGDFNMSSKKQQQRLQQKHKSVMSHKQPNFIGGSNMHKKNDSLFQVRKHARNSTRVGDVIVSLQENNHNNHPYSKKGGSGLSTQGPISQTSRTTRFTSDGTTSRKPRMNGSISNLPLQTMNRLSQHMSHRSRHSISDISPMKQKVPLDQQTEVPKELGDNFYLVKKKFHYQRPKRYKIEFARPAVFINGCLTCGNEHFKVENYGERYCCTNCQKSLQTPSGESVTLRVSHNGRFIVAQAWRYSQLVKGLKVNIDDLRIRGGHKCHATFAGERGDIIVLLDEVNENFVYM